MRRRDIPYVVKGLNRLFDSPEIQAVVGIFRYMAGLIAAADLRSLWDDASLLPADAGHWAEALAVLDEGRDFDRGERWGVYNIQRLYLEFLEALGLREETVPGDAGAARAGLLPARASSARRSPTSSRSTSTPSHGRSTRRSPRGSSTKRPATTRSPTPTSATRRPMPSTLTTVHQAKGMQWPAVFLPCLRANRFPAKRQGGLGLFHVIPEIAIGDADRYKGTLDDETRLFYVAVTRAQKYLFVSFSPGPNQLYRRRSVFFDHCAAQQWFSTRDPGVPSRRSAA